EIDSMSWDKLNRKLTSPEPPLEQTFEIINEADGSLTLRTSMRRGLLCLNFVGRENKRGVEHRPLTAKDKFTRLAIILRALLRKADCPTDLEYVWIRIAGGEWH